ncbi:MAG: type IV pilus biogenesis/stability protein PilW [Congregibacter sp.]|nr:type IV pilus biogenesis/stability protein PilW [Congregibacter sp.]
MIRFVVLLVALTLAGCVTERESVFTEPPSPKKAMETRVSLARQYIGQGNWEDAKRNLKVAADLDATNPEVYEAFALVYQSTGEFELAEDSFRRAINLDKSFSRARNNYAAFLYGQERYREAEEQLSEVIKDTLYSARPQAFLNLGLCRLKLFDERGAEEAFLRTLAMQSGNTTALLEVAQLRVDAGDARNASLYYDKYRKLVRQQSSRALWLGVRLARLTGDENAESSYALALRNLFPDSPDYDAYRRSISTDDQG